MDRIKGAGHINNRFVTEDIAAGRPPTEITETWLNSLQEEIVSVITAAGIVLNVGDSAQLLSALRAAGVFQTQPTNDRSTKVATTAFANPVSLLAASGYLALPSGMIIQWGSLNVPAGGDASWTFPVVFPNSVFKVFPATANATSFVSVSASPAGTVSALVSLRNSAGSGVSGSVAMLAFGF